MIRIIILLSVSLISIGVNTFSQDQPDSLAIIQAALDYFEGWYEGDTNRLHRGLHDQLTKQTKKTDKASGKEVISDGSKEKLIHFAGNRGNSNIPKDELNITITIFDIHGDMASVLVQSKDYFDYAHVLKINDNWQIIHVLWVRKPKPEN
jgi:hypothetical protein